MKIETYGQKSKTEQLLNKISKAIERKRGGQYIPSEWFYNRQKELKRFTR